MKKIHLLYLRLLAALAGVVLAANVSEQIFGLFTNSPEQALTVTFFSIGLIFILAFSIFYLSQGTQLPPFVVAIFFGIAAQPLLTPIVHEREVMGALVGFGATLILFGGGLETVYVNFKKILLRILSLSFVGLLITASLLSWFLYIVSPLLGMPLSIPTVILLGAILASTDPASIIPVLKRLRFKQADTKDLIISESAVTDVAGTLLTTAFLALFVAGGANAFGVSVFDGYLKIFSAETGAFMLKQFLFGVLFGVLGFALLTVLTRFKTTHEREHEVDAAFFLFIPITMFAFAIAFGGSGYLAAFIAGLLFVMTDHLEETERFFNHIIDGFFKPTIFLLLGALVNLPELIHYAPIGLAAALAFIFLIRPISVFLSLGSFALFGNRRLKLSQLWFISCVRETGAIPAVLLVTTVSFGFTGIEGLVPVGMWIILTTLILEPPLTPWLAKTFKVADVIGDDPLSIKADGLSFVMLGTRGVTYKKRLPVVANWAMLHHIPKVVVLLCLEYKYNPELEQTVREDVEEFFEELNRSFEEKGLKPLKFTLISSVGFLQENIEYLSKNEKRLLAIFVGRKMLDYRLRDVKKMSVPIQFLK